MRGTRLPFWLMLLLLPVARAQENAAYPVNDRHIVYHDVRVDASGGIVPWFSDDPSQAYDHDIRLVWNFWIHMRKCSNGVPYYLQHQVWKPEQDDPRGLGGDQIDMALDAWNLLYGYLGDAAVKQNMILMADYWLDHGMSSPSALWANLPFPYNTEIHSGQYDGDMRAGKGYLQPDKAGSFGTQLVMLYKATGNPRYLAAAVKIADSLAVHVTAGDADHSPWPFRVNATTGEVAKQESKGKVYTAAYTSNWSPSLRLFSALEDLRQGNVAAYRRTAAVVTAWLKAYPIVTNKWGPFFEDIDTASYSDTEINADTMAAYILEHPGWDRDGLAKAHAILNWSFTRLGNHSFEKIHVVPINEQTVYLVPGNSHTSRHAAVELLYCEKSGDCKDKEAAVRRLNWATYSVDSSGQNRYPNDDVWLTDGYGDYVRHYLRAMASSPELAPNGQNHLLRTSSVIQQIKYAPEKVTYRKFDAQSIERLKIGAGVPVSVAGGTMHWDAVQKVLIVEAKSREVAIVLRPVASKGR